MRDRGRRRPPKATRPDPASAPGAGYADDALLESERGFRSLAEAMPQIVWITRPDGANIYFNQRWVDYTGLTLEESYGDGWLIPFHPDDRPRAQAAWHKATTTGGIYDLEVRLRRADGAYRWWLVRGSPFRDAGGAITKWFGTCTDIEDLRQARSAFELSAANYDAVFDTTLLGIAHGEIVLDEQGRPVDYRYLRVNDTFEELTGLKREDVVGRTMREIVPGFEDSPFDFIGVHGRVALTGEPVEFEQYQEHLGRWYSVHVISPLKGQFISMFSDITERRRAEEQFAQAARLYATLSQVNQAIVRVKEPAELYQSVCDVAVKFGEFTLAWVGLLDEGSGDVRPVAANGADLANWPFEVVNTHKGVSKNGLVATAIRSHEIAITGDVETDEKMGSVLGQVEGRDYHSIAAIPFGSTRETAGVLVLVSPRAGLFEEASEVGLLNEMSHDISFALETMATEAQRKRAEEALSESEQQYRGLFETSPVPVSLNEAVCDADGQPRDYRFLYVNPAFEKFMSMTAAKLVGHTIVEVAPLVNRAMVDRACRVALTGVPDYFEGHSIGLAKDHETTVYSPKRGQFVTFIVDVTERKRAEEQLAAHAARLKVLADASQAFAEAGPDTQAVVDRVVYEIAEVLADSCQIRLLSDDAERMELVGIYDRDPEASQAVRDLAAQIAVRTDDPGPLGRARNGDATLMSAVDPEELLASYPPELRPVCERFMPRSFMLVPLIVDARAIGALSLTRYRDEQPPFTEDDLALAQDLAGRAALAISNARLVGEVQGELVQLKRAEEEILALNETLEERVQDRTAALEAANHELEAFSYSVSHDLRAPLRHVDGFGKILLEEHASQLDAEGRRLLRRMVANSNQMGLLIDDLLDFSRVTRKELEHRSVDMDRLVRAVCEDLRAGHTDREIEFDVGPLCAVPGDQALLRQVWGNLIGNAVKFTGTVERPRIEVRCERASGVCLYTVDDNGVGFDETYAGKLFQPFQRLHQSTEFEGTGIGLAIVARIVERHRGHVWAKGTPGAGATFGFSLPEETEAV